MSKVLRAKYFPKGGILNAEAKCTDSYLWRSWIGAKNLLQKCLKFQLGDGKSVRIWESPWLQQSNGFKSITPKPLNCPLTWARELMTLDGKSWDNDRIKELFLPQDLEVILNLPISQVGSKDKLI